MSNRAVALLLLCCLGACDQSGHPDGNAGQSGNTTSDSSVEAPFSTGLEPSRTLSSLTEPEIQQLCQAANDWYIALVGEDELRQYACVIESIGASLDVQSDGGLAFDLASCEAATAACLVTGPQMMIVACQQDDIQQSVASCTATVAQYEACNTAVLSDPRARGVFVSCAQYASSLANPPAPEPDRIGLQAYPECTPLQENCTQ